MKKIDLIVYKDKIKKLHKAAVALKEAHDEYEEFQKNKLLNDDFNISDDWNKLNDFMKNNPDLSEKLDEVESIIDKLNEV